MRRYSKESIVGLFMLAGLASIGVLTLQLGDLGLLADDSYPLSAHFHRVTGLRSGSAVVMHGLEIGRVGRLSLDPEQRFAVVELRIRRGIRIYDDAIASIKTEGLIGDRYVSIDPGGSGEVLQPGGRILETESPTEIMDLVGRYAFGDVKK
ncbi:MAG: outer membrane lipid asymmetry maintenance protein MlaD [Desulfobacterales bacterium]